MTRKVRLSQRRLLKEVVFQFDPKTASQALARKLFFQEDKKVIFLIGAAGCGKSHAAVAMALEYICSPAFKQESSGDTPIILTRPVVEAADEHLGFLPGTAEQKIDPYLQPATTILEKLKNDSQAFPPDFSISSLFKAVPLALMRGWTIPHIGILEEAQNCNRAQLLLFLTRMGKGARLLITADPAQHDRIEDAYPINRLPILDVINKLKDMPEVGVVRMPASDTMRDPWVAEVVRRLGADLKFE